MVITSRGLGRCHYLAALELQSAPSHPGALEILWFEPEPIVTLGLRAEPLEGVLSVEVLRVNRGGGATYHGPGQIVFFPICHLPSAGLTVRKWVGAMLQATVGALKEWDVEAGCDFARPGVYTQRGKIASIGLKIQNGWNRHGLALNVNGDLKPFAGIRACGVEGARMDQIADWQEDVPDFSLVAETWVRNLENALISL